MEKKSKTKRKRKTDKSIRHLKTTGVAERQKHQENGFSLREGKKKRTQVGQSYTTVKAPISSDPGR